MEGNLIDTGTHSQTGAFETDSRVCLGRRCLCFTYGDGLSDLAIDDLTAFHFGHGKKQLSLLSVPRDGLEL